MSATPHHQDPTPARIGTVRALFRLREYAGPALPFIVAGMVAALIAQLIALAIPQVLQAIVDGPLADGDASAIWPFAGLVFALGVLEAGMIALRRWFVLTPGTRVEARMRNALYARLQDLPVSFHDRWPSGQLLSRAVSDLGLIRRWLSFGLVLLVVNLIVIVVGLVILVSMNWMLGLVFLVCSIPLWVVGYRFEGRYSEVSRRSQDQAGDLATAVEESVHGIRVLKAFGRGKHALSTFRAQAESLRSTEIEKARLDAGIWTWILVVPTVALAVCLVLGVWLASQGALTVGELVAFFATATVLAWPIESIGFLLAFSVDARTATDRFFDILDSENEITDPERPVAIERPRGELVFTDVRFRYQDSPDRFGDLLDGVDLALEPGETMALVGLTGSGKTTLTALTTRLYDVTERLDHARRRRHPRAVPRGAAHAHRDGVRGRDPVQRLGARQRAARPARARRRRARGARGGRARAHRGAAHRAGGIRLRPARRRRHEGRRGGHEPLGRPAAAPRARACGRGIPVGARARRPALGARRRDGGEGGGRAAQRARVDDRAHRGAPPVDGHARRPRRAPRGGADHGRRHALRAPARERALRLRHLEPRGRGATRGRRGIRPHRARRGGGGRRSELADAAASVTTGIEPIQREEATR